MGNTNYISAIVRILENPTQKVLDKNIPVTEVRVQFPQIRNNTIVNLVFWGKLSQDIIGYYNIDDYIIVEGYLGLQDNKFIKNFKNVEITVLKVYPFLLSYTHESDKV